MNSIVSSRGDEQEEEQGGGGGSRISALDVIRITASNQHLQDWSLGSWVELSPHTLGLMTWTLSRITTQLTTLELGLAFSPPRNWLTHFLKRLPQSVKTLYAFWIPAKQGEEEAEQDTRPSFTDVGLAESYPSLEVANFSISLEEAQEEASFFQFLKRCPNLTSLGCPMIVDPRGVAKFIQLLESPLVLPSMKELNIGLQPIDNLWKPLVIATKSRQLHSFTTDADTMTISPDALSAVTTYWSRTMETLRLPGLYSHHIQLVLTTCFQLKKFDCVWTADHELLQEDAEVEEPSKWACSRLEELKMAFADGRTYSALTEGSVVRMQEERAMRRIRRAYTQIGHLTNLKRLCLGWRSLDSFKDRAHLDMSLEGGLGLLENLKALRMLDVSSIRHIKIGQGEVEWMVSHWPNLKKVRGLTHRLVKTVPEPEYVAWLRKERPRMEIS
ncbi:hypothetical protein BGX31_008593 [Mortierella sp. GBA43]|nr:hypothetical protein BGX31_008593 [Mortierella sp. GBA43]